MTQTYQPDELIEVDDGSTDGSYELAKQILGDIPWATVIKKPNGGQLSCISRGIAAATGEIIAFLDSDDKWHSDHLEKAMPYFEKHQDLSLYFTPYQEFDLRGKRRTVSMGYAKGLIGRTFVTTASGMSYVGSTTSTMVVRSSYLKPYLGSVP